MLVTDYQITRGEVWVVPNLNFESIIKRSRGVYGDMNRKFLDIPMSALEFWVALGGSEATSEGGPLMNGAIGTLVAQVNVNPTAGNPWSGKVQTILNWLGAFGLWGALAAILVGAATMGLARQMHHQGGSSAGVRMVMSGAFAAVLVGSSALIVNSFYAL